MKGDSLQLPTFGEVSQCSPSRFRQRWSAGEFPLERKNRVRPSTINVRLTETRVFRKRSVLSYQSQIIFDASRF
jgi:hypothetical protein